MLGLQSVDEGDNVSFDRVTKLYFWSFHKRKSVKEGI